MNSALALYRACARQLKGLGLRRFALVNRVNDWVVNRVKSRQAMVNGHPMFLDARDSLDLSLNQVYEPFETDLIQSRVKPGDTVLDVGANIGYYTLLFAKRVGPRGQVFAFEPEPDNFSLLEKNIRANDYRNVVAVNAALSDRAGKLNLHVCDENRGDHRIYLTDEKRLAVEVTALVADQYLDSLRADVQFVKIDVQGAEAKVLRGMQNLLRRSRACQVAMEFWPLGIDRAGDDVRQMLDLLAELGFSFQKIDERQARLEEIGPAHLLREFTVAKGNQTNLLLTKRSCPERPSPR